MAAVRAVLTEAGLVAKDYAGHSFRIGAATTAGIQDSLIKTLGRWESAATSGQYCRGSKPTHVGHLHINEHVISWILLNPSLLFNI